MAADGTLAVSTIPEAHNDSTIAISGMIAVVVDIVFESARTGADIMSAENMLNLTCLYLNVYDMLILTYLAVSDCLY